MTWEELKMQILCEICGEVIATFESEDFNIIRKAVCLDCHSEKEEGVN